MLRTEEMIDCFGSYKKTGIPQLSHQAKGAHKAAVPI